ERILAEIDEAEAAAAADVVEPRGVLKVNAPLAFGMREIMPAVADYLAAHPAVTVDLGLTDRFVDLVDEGWDLAIRIGALRDSTRAAPARRGAAALGRPRRRVPAAGPARGAGPPRPPPVGRRRAPRARPPRPPRTPGPPGARPGARGGVGAEEGPSSTSPGWT